MEMFEKTTLSFCILPELKEPALVEGHGFQFVKLVYRINMIVYTVLKRRRGVGLTRYSHTVHIQRENTTTT